MLVLFRDVGQLVLQSGGVGSAVYIYIYLTSSSPSSGGTYQASRAFRGRKLPPSGCKIL